MREVLDGARRWLLEVGESADVLRSLPDNSIDAIVCDPPAGISFMGQAFDHDRGGRLQWIAWLAGIMREALRTLKPGGHALVWALPRTSHWTATALEEAGFEIRDCLFHLFASGFPKSLDVSKAIDAAAGARREILGVVRQRGAPRAMAPGGASRSADPSTLLTAPATPEAAQWEGWGTATKPAVENWWLCRKPLEGTVAATVLKYGTGALNIDGSRVEGKRWPSHFVASHLPACEPAGVERVRGAVGGTPKVGIFAVTGKYRWGDQFYSWEELPENARDYYTQNPALRTGYADASGLETVAAWRCAPGCPVRDLDLQGGERKSGSRAAGVRKGLGYHGAEGDGGPEIKGSAGPISRFFPVFQDPVEAFPVAYHPKPSRAEKEAGCSHLPPRTGAEAVGREEGSAGLQNPRAGGGRTAGEVRNFHPTPKGLSLGKWLSKLICPPGGVILDPFAGSASLGCAALIEGFRWIGIEMDPAFAEIARARLAHWEKESAPKAEPEAAPVGQLDLFGGEK